MQQQAAPTGHLGLLTTMKGLEFGSRTTASRLVVKQ
jgi:hypothetical protein